MTRTAPRSRKTATKTAATTAPKRAAAAAPRAVVSAGGDGWERTLDMTRAMLGMSLDASREWMQGLGDWQQAQAATLHDACRRIEQFAGQTERAPDWPTLWALQANLAGTQWAQAMDDCTALAEQVMQIESRLVERGRADATRLSQRWLEDLDGAPVGDKSDMTELGSPLAVIGQAQAAMAEMSRLWTQALYNTALPD